MKAHHTFHIPVMGLAYTIDSPIKVARFGISSVISIVEDRLIEMMRRYYYGELQEKYVPITTHEPDYRAKRITDYLNLVNRIVLNQIDEMKKLTFERGTELSKYFELLPSASKVRAVYEAMLQTKDADKRKAMEEYLRSEVVPGSIDVNIMTKVDGNNSGNKGSLIENGTDAVSALRGYALSNLENTSLIFSAGLNPRLFNYLEQLDAFAATAWGEFKKRIVVKVSDYRSALIQGKYLAKKGIWVSEFRIESGLNCGGHAFATDGYLLGPILKEFVDKKDELIDALHTLYNAALKVKGRDLFEEKHPIAITVQGGIGTHAEDEFLREEYGVSSTGWGTPFLLCPEATTVDADTLQKLCQADETNVLLSNASPLGVRFHYLKGTTAEKERSVRIADANPGSPCTEKHLAFNTEFTDEPICTASKKYQKLKIAQLQSLNLSVNEYQKQVDQVLEKECLCVGLSNAASLVYGVPFLKSLTSVTICPGPNIAFFSRIVTLQEMVDHIYGRIDLLEHRERPHVFINELRLYISYLAREVSESGEDEKRRLYNHQFADNLIKGIAYYKELQLRIDNEHFIHDLEDAEERIGEMMSMHRASN